MVTVLPQYDPWGQVGQSFGGGMSDYLSKSVDQARFRNNLSVAEQLMKPGPNGEMPNPTQTLFGMLKATGGDAAALNAVSEMYPAMLAERQRLSGTKPGTNPYRQNAQPTGQPQQQPGLGDRTQPMPQNRVQRAPQRLPDGEVPNARPRGPQNQQGAPYNEQQFADQTGGTGPGGAEQPPVMERPEAKGPQRPRDIEQAYEAANAPPKMMEARSDRPPERPKLQEFPLEQQAEVYDSVINNGGTSQQGHERVREIQSGINESNNIRLKEFELDSGIRDASRTIDQQQDDLINRELGSKGWDNPYNQMVARQLFNESASIEGLNNDLQRWDWTNRKLQHQINAETNITAGTGRPWIWEDPSQAIHGAKTATKSFMDASGAYNPKTKKYDLRKYNRAVDLNVANDWHPDEAREITIPLSERANNAVRKAPKVYGVEIPKGWEDLAPGRAHEPNVEKMDKATKKVAKDLWQNLGPYDSLLVTRRKLFNNAGYNDKDFLRIVDEMQALGWTPSELQQQELGLLSEPMQASLGEILKGKGMRKLFIVPRGLK